MDFEYDRQKSEANKAKHGIDFEEAQALWQDAALNRSSRPGDGRAEVAGHRKMGGSTLVRSLHAAQRANPADFRAARPGRRGENL